MKVILISACKTKNAENGLAKDMYVGDFSEKAYRFATKIEHDKILFLSTKYNVVEPEQEVEKINLKFSEMKNSEKRQWAEKTLKQFIKKGIDVEKDTLVFLTPKDYWMWIVEKQQKDGKSTENFVTPLKNLSQGWQKHWITEKLNEVEKK